MDAEQLELGEVAGHLIEADGAPDAAHPALTLVHEAVAHLHHDGDVELAALGIVGVVLGIVRRELEPVWIEVSADESVVPHPRFKVAQALHAAIGVHPCEAGEAGGVALADFVDPFVGNLERAGEAHVARPHRDHQRKLDVGAVHLFDVIVDGDAAAHFCRHPDLVLEDLVDPGLTLLHLLRRVRIDDDIDRFHRICPCISRPFQF